VAKAGAASRTVADPAPTQVKTTAGRAKASEAAADARARPTKAATKAPDAKTSEAKTSEAKAAAVKPTEAKADTKPTKAAPSDPKGAEGKAADTKTPGESKLSAKTLEKLRKTLVDERDVILRQASALEAEAEQLAADRDGGDTQFDEESGEGDSLNIERERDLMLSAHARHTLDEIDAALARMDAGTYGICEVSGKPIPVERLEAIPWARVRAEVQAKRERRR
jgi:RNA polymerase-binding transcription factor DksA